MRLVQVPNSPPLLNTYSSKSKKPCNCKAFFMHLECVATSSKTTEKFNVNDYDDLVKF